MGDGESDERRPNPVSASGMGVREGVGDRVRHWSGTHHPLSILPFVPLSPLPNA